MLPQALQARATNTANPSTAFAAGHGAGSPLTLLNYPRAISSDQVTIGFKQSIGAGDTLRAGQLRQDADVHAVDDDSVS